MYYTSGDHEVCTNADCTSPKAFLIPLICPLVSMSWSHPIHFEMFLCVVPVYCWLPNPVSGKRCSCDTWYGAVELSYVAMAARTLRSQSDSQPGNGEEKLLDPEPLLQISSWSVLSYHHLENSFQFSANFTITRTAVECMNVEY